MRITTLFAAAILTALCVQPALAADPAPAKSMVTVFISKGSASAVTKALNEMHAKMEADGWAYKDMGVYTENGDLQGLFVTYVRPAAAPAN